MKNKIMDSESGRLVFNEDISIKGGMGLDDLQIALRSHTVVFQHNDLKTNWEWVYARNLRSGGFYFCVSFGFHFKKLSCIDLTVSNKEYPENPSWEDYSEEAEKRNFEFYKTWVDDQLGGNESLKWGSIGAAWDFKNNASSIVIRYQGE